MTDGVARECKETIGACDACGNSPVHHFGSYAANTLSVWSSRLGARKSTGLFGALRNISDTLYDRLEPYIFPIFASLPTAHFEHDHSAACTYRSQVIWEEALRRGIHMEQMVIFGIHTEIYRAKLAGSWKYFTSLPTPPELERGSMHWADDKYILKEILREHGIPTPRVISVSAARQALGALGVLQSAAIKPRSGSRGRHTTVGVQTEQEMKEAFTRAQQLCRYVAIEQHLEGSVCRATVVGGRLVGFFQAYPPRITGDGKSTIAELIEKQNVAKPDRVQDIAITSEHRGFIRRLGFTELSVLPAGRSIALTHRTGRLFGGYTRELLGREHPALRSYAEAAARAIRAPIVGFDLIIKDPESDPDDQEWGIIEANLLPFIDLHYLPLEGTSSNVAAAVWDLWGERARA